MFKKNVLKLDTFLSCVTESLFLCEPKTIDDEYPASEVIDTYLHWFSSYLECVWLWGHMLDVIRSPPPLSANQRFSFLSIDQWDAWLSDDGGAAISVDINTWGDQGPGVVACGLMVSIWDPWPGADNIVTDCTNTPHSPHSITSHS